MRRVWVLVALVCGCGPSSFDDFRNQLAKVSCDRQVRCGLIGASERKLCPPPDVANLPGTRGFVEEPDVGVAAGRMRFFSTAAQDCLDAVNGASCDDASLVRRIVARCNHVLEPGVEAGLSAMCYAGECAGGICNTPGGGCGGRCVPYLPIGAPCAQPGDCDPSVAYCGAADSSSGMTVCRFLKQPGEACNGPECAFGWTCNSDGTTATCGDPPSRKKGESCADPSLGFCEDALYCSAAGVCAEPIVAGQPCDVPFACKPGFACTGLTVGTMGTCTAWSDVGGACTAAGMSGCPSSQSCVSGACQANVTDRAVGYAQPCSADADCAPTLYCRYGVCRFRVGIGGSCANLPSACASGLTCDGKTCIAPACGA
jgi:hypothetical protein